MISEHHQTRLHSCYLTSQQYPGIKSRSLFYYFCFLTKQTLQSQTETKCLSINELNPFLIAVGMYLVIELIVSKKK